MIVEDVAPDFPSRYSEVLVPVDGFRSQDENDAAMAMEPMESMSGFMAFPWQNPLQEKTPLKSVTPVRITREDRASCNPGLS